MWKIQNTDYPYQYTIHVPYFLDIYVCEENIRNSFIAKTVFYKPKKL